MHRATLKIVLAFVWQISDKSSSIKFYYNSSSGSRLFQCGQTWRS